MENIRIRVRFSSIMKNLSKTNLKCHLEIVPLVTSIENIDKLKWKHEKDKIEYIFPVNHKIIIKKLKPNPELIKIYYSCVDLLPSLLSNVDIDTNNIYRVISDNNVILNKEKTDLMTLTNIPLLGMEMDKTLHHLQPTNLNYHPKGVSLDLSDFSIRSINISEKHKTESIQTDNIEDTEKIRSRIIVDNTNIDNNTSTSIVQNNHNRKLCINLKYNNVQPKDAKDYFVIGSLRNNRGHSLITDILQETPLVSKYNNNIKYIKTSNMSYMSSSRHIINGSFKDEAVIPNIRIQPEIRVAKFVEKIKKEIMPLKILLDNLIVKCLSLGVYKSSLSNNLLLDLGINHLHKYGVEREKSNNRVVYSIVFDE